MTCLTQLLSVQFVAKERKSGRILNSIEVIYHIFLSLKGFTATPNLEGDTDFEVRRLSTPSSIKCENKNFSTKWLWHYESEDGIWYCYDDTCTTSITSGTGTIMSDTIEEAYLKGECRITFANNSDLNK